MASVGNMAPKQKVMLALTVVMFLGVVYMIYNMFFASPDYSTPTSVKAPAPAPQPQTNNVQQPAQYNQPMQQGQMNPNGQPMQQGQMNPNGQPMQQGQMNPNGQPMQQGQMNQNGQMNTAYQQPPAVTVMPAEKLTPEQIAILQQQQAVRDKYLALINQYQMTQMQQKVAQAQAGLYKSQLDAGKTAKEAQDLGIPLDTDGGPGAGGLSSHYSVAYIGRINGAWSAMLLANGQYLNVKVGSSLPDGSVVSQISNSRVTVFKDGERRHLMLATVMDKSENVDLSSGASTTPSRPKGK